MLATDLTRPDLCRPQATPREAKRSFRPAISLLAAMALLFQSLCAPATARQMSRDEYEACQARDDGSFKTAIEVLTTKALQAGLAKVDYRGVVGDEWRRSSMDEVLDKRVDIAVGEVGNETSLWERGRSLFDKEKAQALSISVAERVFRSDPVKVALEGVTTGVAKQVGRSIELAASDAAEPALECLKAFLGPRYGTTVAGVVSADAFKEFQIDPAKAGAGVSAGSVLSESGAGLTGAVILVVRRQLANIAGRIGQRMVGAVLGRLVSVAAGGIGVVLIAKDLWDFRNGVLPIIATELKSKPTKDLVQAELAKAISEQINEHTREISSATADRVIEIWREYRRGHAKVLELAERHDGFRKYLDTLRPTDLPRLDEVIALILAAESEDAVLKRLANGTLAQAVTRLPAGGMDIARETRSIEQALGWTTLAGAALPKVLDLGLHRRTTPADLTAPQLNRLLALDDQLATTRLAGISRGARDQLLELPDRDLKGLARGVTEAELETLSTYLTGLEPKARERVLKTVAVTPARMQVLGSARVRDAVLSSKDQLAAVSMMLRTDTGFDIAIMRDDVELVYGGRISPLLLWDKHPAAIIAAGVGLLILLLVLRRLVAPRRRPANA